MSLLLVCHLLTMYPKEPIASDGAAKSLLKGISKSCHAIPMGLLWAHVSFQGRRAPQCCRLQPSCSSFSKARVAALWRAIMDIAMVALKGEGLSVL